MSSIHKTLHLHHQTNEIDLLYLEAFNKSLIEIDSPSRRLWGNLNWEEWEQRLFLDQLLCCCFRISLCILSIPMPLRICNTPIFSRHIKKHQLWISTLLDEQSKLQLHSLGLISVIIRMLDTYAANLRLVIFSCSGTPQDKWNWPFARSQALIGIAWLHG